MEVKIKIKQVRTKYIEVQMEKEDLDNIDEIIEKAKHKAMRMYSWANLSNLSNIPKELSPTAKLYLLSRSADIVSKSIDIVATKRKGKEEVFEYEYKNDPFFRKEYEKCFKMWDLLATHTKNGLRAKMEKDKAKK